MRIVSVLSQVHELIGTDPCIIQVDNDWYSFATRTIGSSIHIQFAISDSLGSWTMVYNEDGSQWDALPYLPPWVNGEPNTWAPDVNQLVRNLGPSVPEQTVLTLPVQDDGTFVMYFAATTAQDYSRHCVGAAFSDEIAGPICHRRNRCSVHCRKVAQSTHPATMILVGVTWCTKSSAQMKIYVKVEP